MAGIEPARPFGQGILSPLRLPFRHIRNKGLDSREHTACGNREVAFHGGGGILFAQTIEEGLAGFGRRELAADHRAGDIIPWPGG